MCSGCCRNGGFLPRRLLLSDVLRGFEGRAGDLAETVFGQKQQKIGDVRTHMTQYPAL